MASIEQLQADWVDPPRVLFYRDNPQDIFHNVFAPGGAIAWDNIAKDTFGISGTNGDYTSVTIPDGHGITRARATGSLHFAARSDYLKAVGMIAKNGLGIPGAPHESRVGASYDFAPQINLKSGWFDVVPGDRLQLLAYQMNAAQATSFVVGAGFATWLEVEFRR